MSLYLAMATSICQIGIIIMKLKIFSIKFNNHIKIICRPGFGVTLVKKDLHRPYPRTPESVEFISTVSLGFTQSLSLSLSLSLSPLFPSPSLSLGQCTGSCTEEILPNISSKNAFLELLLMWRLRINNCFALLYDFIHMLS